MKKWILRTFIVLLVTGLVAGAVYLIVNKTASLDAAGLPAGQDMHGQARPGEGREAPEGFSRPENGKDFPRDGKGDAFGLEGRGGREGGGRFGLAGIGRSLLIVAATVLGVLLLQFGIRRLRRKPQPAVVPAAPIDAAPVESEPPVE